MDSYSSFLYGRAFPSKDAEAVGLFVMEKIAECGRVRGQAENVVLLPTAVLYLMSFSLTGGVVHRWALSHTTTAVSSSTKSLRCALQSSLSLTVRRFEVLYGTSLLACFPGRL